METAAVAQRGASLAAGQLEAVAFIRHSARPPAESLQLPAAHDPGIESRMQLEKRVGFRRRGPGDGVGDRQRARLRLQYDVETVFDLRAGRLKDEQRQNQQDGRAHAASLN